MTQGGGCPFRARKGYVDGRADYMYHFQNYNSNGNVDSDSKSKEKNLPTESMMASTNIEDPLYYWQLYSLIGHGPVLDIVTEFYDRVFDDTDNPWFRNVFEDAAPKGVHINAQAAYWIDAFGGGKKYHGGDYRLKFHHTHNARQIMTAKGAQRWMHHMKNALLVMVKSRLRRLLQNDPRIFPCIVEFLETKMRTYAMDHGWEFDESDFLLLKEEAAAAAAAAATAAAGDKKNND